MLVKLTAFAAALITLSTLGTLIDEYTGVVSAVMVLVVVLVGSFCVYSLVSQDEN